MKLTDDKLQKLESENREIDELVDYVYHIDSCYYIIINKVFEGWIWKLWEDCYKLALTKFLKSRNLDELKIDLRKMRKYSDIRQRAIEYYNQNPN